MKRRERTDLQFQSTLAGRATGMTIAPEAMAHIMSMLSDLYKYPELAIIREYSTNAWDAHVMAGVPLPIEVTLPSRMSPFLRIRDHGIGLSEDELHNVYSQYGTSTKSNSDEFNGMLGIGCKSAFAYTSQFSIVSVKDGVLSRGSISKDGNDAGVLVVEDAVETTADPGTIVEIPTRVGDEYVFQKGAKHLFSYWPAGTVLVNGVEPAPFEGETVNEQFAIISGDTNYVVMGNVPYAVPRGEIMSGLNGRYSLVVQVPIGSVDIQQNRETLKMTAFTKETLKALGTEFQDISLVKAQEDVDAAPTRREALLRRRKWINKVQNIDDATLTYKGETVPVDYRMGKDAEGKQQYLLYAPKNNGWKISDNTRTDRVDMERAVEGIFFYNYERSKFTPAIRKKMDLFFRNNLAKDENQSTPLDAYKDWTGYFLTKEKIAHPWIPESRMFDFEVEIAPLKLPRAARSATDRKLGSYDAIHEGETFEYENGLLIDEVPEEGNVFYVEGTLRNTNTYERVFNHVYGSDYTLVALSTNRVNKFKRLRPNAIPARDRYETVKALWIQSIPEDSRFGLAYRKTLGKFLQLRKPFSFYYFDDPELVRACEIASTDWEEVQQECFLFNHHFKNEVDGLIDFHDRYPLFRHLEMGWYSDKNDHGNQADMIDYVNAVYHTTIAGE